MEYRKKANTGTSIARGVGILLLLVPLLASCRIPESMAGIAADRFTKVWFRVKSIEAVMLHSPDLLDHPEKTCKVLYREKYTGQKKNVFANRILAPEDLAGSCSGGRWGSVWIWNNQSGELLLIEGMRPWVLEKNMKILKHVIAQNFRTMDFQIGEERILGRKTRTVLATPVQWAPHQFKAYSAYDPETGFVLRFRAINREDQERNGWEVLEYRSNIDLNENFHEPPAQGVTARLGWRIGDRDHLAERGASLPFKPLVASDWPAVHNVQQAGGVVGLVSDYTDELRSLYLVQWQRSGPVFRVPYERKVDMGRRNVGISMHGPYITILFADDQRECALLGEIHIEEILGFIDRLSVRSEGPGDSPKL